MPRIGDPPKPNLPSPTSANEAPSFARSLSVPTPDSSSTDIKDIFQTSIHFDRAFSEPVTKKEIRAAETGQKKFQNVTMRIKAANALNKLRKEGRIEQASQQLRNIKNATGEKLSDTHNALFFTRQLAALHQQCFNAQGRPIQTVEHAQRMQQHTQNMASHIVTLFFGHAPGSVMHIEGTKVFSSLLYEAITTSDLTAKVTSQGHSHEEEVFLALSSMMLQLTKSRDLDNIRLGDFVAVRGSAESARILNILSNHIKGAFRTNLLDSVQNDSFKSFLYAADTSDTNMVFTESKHQEFYTALKLLYQKLHPEQTHITNQHLQTLMQTLEKEQIDTAHAGILDIQGHASTSERWTPLVNEFYEMGSFLAQCNVHLDLAPLPNEKVFNHCMLQLSPEQQQQLLEHILSFQIDTKKGLVPESQQSIAQFQKHLQTYIEQQKIQINSEQIKELSDFSYLLFTLHDAQTKTPEAIQQTLLHANMSSVTAPLMRHQVQNDTVLIQTQTSERIQKETLSQSESVEQFGVRRATITRKKSAQTQNRTASEIQEHRDAGEHIIGKIFASEFQHLIERGYTLNMQFDTTAQKMRIMAHHPYPSETSSNA